jgi:hypothetical protein
VDDDFGQAAVGGDEGGEAGSGSFEGDHAEGFSPEGGDADGPGLTGEGGGGSQPWKVTAEVRPSWVVSCSSWGRWGPSPAMWRWAVGT